MEGSKITFLIGSTLKDGDIKCNYTVNNFEITESNYIESISSNRTDTLLVLASKKLRVASAVKKIDKWRWNEENGIQVSNSTFL